MEAVVPGLYASAPEPLSFAPSITVRAFLVQHPAGNVLIYCAGPAADEAGAIDALGGVSRHYLNHWHEAALGCPRIAAALHAPVICHAAERPHVAKTCEVAETFAEQHQIDGDLEAIPIPGHTAGATAYLWDSGQDRCLFTGDSLYLVDGEWRAAVLASSDRAAYVRSLELMRDLDFDVLVPWAASRDQPFHAPTDQADAHRRIDAVLERVRAGSDH